MIYKFLIEIFIIIIIWFWFFSAYRFDFNMERRVPSRMPGYIQFAVRQGNIFPMFETFNSPMMDIWWKPTPLIDKVMMVRNYERKFGRVFETGIGLSGASETFFTMELVPLVQNMDYFEIFPEVMDINHTGPIVINYNLTNQFYKLEYREAFKMCSVRFSFMRMGRGAVSRIILDENNYPFPVNRHTMSDRPAYSSHEPCMTAETVFPR